MLLHATATGLASAARRALVACLIKLKLSPFSTWNLRICPWKSIPYLIIYPFSHNYVLWGHVTDIVHDVGCWFLCIPYNTNNCYLMMAKYSKWEKKISPTKCTVFFLYRKILHQPLKRSLTATDISHTKYYTFIKKLNNIDSMSGFPDNLVLIK